MPKTVFLKNIWIVPAFKNMYTGTIPDKIFYPLIIFV